MGLGLGGCCGAGEAVKSARVQGDVLTDWMWSARRSHGRPKSVPQPGELEVPFTERETERGAGLGRKVRVSVLTC